jgi:predicted RNA-binding Zn-ribbon protein involved in translation (DUF1610 family)
LRVRHYKRHRRRPLRGLHANDGCRDEILHTFPPFQQNRYAPRNGAMCKGETRTFKNSYMLDPELCSKQHNMIEVKHALQELRSVRIQRRQKCRRQSRPYSCKRFPASRLNRWTKPSTERSHKASTLQPPASVTAALNASSHSPN